MNRITMAEAREMLPELAARGVEATKRFTGTKAFDELVRAGRVYKSETPAGDVLHCRSEAIARQPTIDPNSRVVTVVQSDATRDRMGDIIDPNGWDVDNFKNNPVALMDHWYLVKNIVGHIPKTFVNPKGGPGKALTNKIVELEDIDVDFNAQFMGEHHFDPLDQNEASALAFPKILARSLRAVSVGFMTKVLEKIVDKEGNWTGGFLFREMELLEVSWVAVPANPSATIPASVQSEPDATSHADPIDADIEELSIRVGAASILRRLNNR